MPFYKVTQEADDGEEPIAPRLIEAGTPAEALRHAARTTFTISEALTPAGIVQVMTAGARAEKAGQADADPVPESD